MGQDDSLRDHCYPGPEILVLTDVAVTLRCQQQFTPHNPEWPATFMQILMGEGGVMLGGAQEDREVVKGFLAQLLPTQKRKGHIFCLVFKRDCIVAHIGNLKDK